MNDNASGNKRIARNSLFLSIRMVFVLCINLYTTRAVLNALGVEDYGVYNVVCGCVSMFSFLSTAISNGIQRFFNFELAKNGIEGGKKVYNTALLIQFILAILFFAILETVGLWYLNNHVVVPMGRENAAFWIFQFAVISFILIVIQSPFSAAIMAHEKMDYYAIVSVSNAVLNLFVALILDLFSFDKLVFYGSLILLVNITTFLMNVIYARLSFVEIRIERLFDRKLLREMIGFSGWNLFGSFSGIMMDQGMNLLLNSFFGPVVNAARGVTMQIRGGLQSFVQNITIPIRPQVIQSYAKGDINRTINLTFSISKLSCLLLFALSLPILVEINYVLDTWLKGNVPEHTSTFAFIVIAITFINNLNSAVSGVVHASGKMRNYQVSTSLVALLSLPVCYLALKYEASPELAMCISFLFIALSQFVALLVLRTIVSFKLKHYFEQVLLPVIKVAIVCLWMPVILHIYISEGFLRFAVIIFASELCVIPAAYFLALNHTEKTLIKDLLYKLKKKKTKDE